MKKHLFSFFVILNTVFVYPISFIVQNKYVHPEVPLQQELRLSSYPYISGDTFRNICNHFIDEVGIPFDPQTVKDGDLIFLNTNYAEFFFTEVHPHITAKYILISHNSIHPGPGKYVQYLKDETLCAWFAKNVSLPEHPKMHPLPIGFANSYWPHGNVDLVEEIAQQDFSKNKFVYMNFAKWTNPGQRELVAHIFANKPYCFIAKPKPYPDYLKDIATSYFVLSPEGAGIDCHRTWEALYMGSIPVVKHSTIDKLFEDLPVLLIDDWHQVNEQFLLQQYEIMLQKNYNYQKLHAQYWINQIRDVQKKIKKKDLKKNNPKQFVLITSLYNETNQKRIYEYITCLKNNLKHDRIKTIHVVYDTLKDTKETPILDFLKKNNVNIYYIKGRPTYGCCFDIARKNYPNSNIIIANGDIYFNNTLSLLDEIDLTNKFFALTRWEVQKNLKDLQIYMWPNQQQAIYSQDVWIFQSPLKPLKEENITMGIPHCDGKIVYQAYISGLKVLNPCYSLQCCHLHLSDIHNYEYIPFPQDGKIMSLGYANLQEKPLCIAKEL